jgi:phosphotriesterase-related protein
MRQRSTRREFLTQLAGASAVVLTPNVWMPRANERHALRAPRPVQPVLGPIDPSKLGLTLPNKHIFAGSAGILGTWPALVGGRTAFRDRVVDKLKAMKAQGVDTIVDVTPSDIGRDVRFLEDVSRRSGVQIVACTGHWLNPSLTMAARTIDELADFFRLEIERGIDGTDIKPGVIKVATDREGVTPFLEKALRAAARASKATGIPVTTHTYAVGRIGEKQAEIFEAEGLSPTSVCLGHSDETTDMDYLTGLARRGYTRGMDHMPHGLRPPTAGLPSWQQRAATILADSSVARELERVPVRRDDQRRCVHIYASAIAAIDTLRPGMRTGSFAP